MIRMNLRSAFEKTLPFAGLAVLVGAFVVVAMITSPHLESVPSPAAVNTADVFALTNDERADEGVPSLQRNALLDQAAQMKATDMAAKAYYAHVSPDGVTPMHWVEKSGYKYLIIGENLVVNRKDAEQVVDAFMGSPGHRANILRKDFKDIGVGVANGTYKGKDATFTVQIFAAPYPTVSRPAVVKESVKPTIAVSKPTETAKTTNAVSVPRATPPSAKAAVASSSIQEKVKTLLQPIVTNLQGTSTEATSTASTTQFSAPPFILNDTSPIELAGVSRLETKTPPMPIGSMWSMEIRSFVEGVLLSARGFFAS